MIVKNKNSSLTKTTFFYAIQTTMFRRIKFFTSLYLFICNQCGITGNPIEQQWLSLWGQNYGSLTFFFQFFSYIFITQVHEKFNIGSFRCLVCYFQLKAPVFLL